MLSNGAGSFSVYSNFVTEYNGTTYWPDYSGLGRVMGMNQGSTSRSSAFNPEGQLLKLDMFSSGVLSSSVNYYYDGLGRRIAKVKSFTADSPSKIVYTYYGLEDRILLATVSKSSSVVQSIFVDGQGIDQHLFEINSVDGAKGLMSDHLGSVINSSAAGDKSAYGIFGENLGAPTPSNSASEALTYGFAGREFDPESGYYYNRARYYDPNTARFLAKDPIGIAGGDTNLYRYVLNNPKNYVDPQGLDTTSVGVSISLGYALGGAFGFNYSTDDHGGSNFNWTKGVGASTKGASLTIDITETNADSVQQLLGRGTATGASMFAPGGGSAQYIEGLDEQGNTTYEGVQYSFGIGTPGVGVSDYSTYTNPIDFNGIFSNSGSMNWDNGPFGGFGSFYYSSGSGGTSFYIGIGTRN